ncbi:MAG: NAD(+)/NADH kinase [Acidimicrobiia bacterium]
MSSDPVRVVGLVPNPDAEEVTPLAARAATCLREGGATVRIRRRDAAAVGLGDLGVEPGVFVESCDVVVSLGGDGTMLHAIDTVYDSGVPVLGVNAGHLGYLTEVDGPGLETALRRLLDGDFTVTERMVLHVTATAGGSDLLLDALNELTLEKVDPGRIARLEVSINGRFFTTYAADGVIVATPTGSTAYSFSARGPIVSPEHRCMLLTPVSPHMLFDRSLVLGPTEQLRFDVAGHQAVHLTTDGREVAILQPGDTVSCTAGERPARVVSFESRDFHQILKAKFGLADR